MNIPDYLLEAILNSSIYRHEKPHLSDEEVVIKELESAYCKSGKSDQLTGLSTANDLYDDIFRFCLGNNQVLEKRTFLCVNIKDLMSFCDFYGPAAGDRLIVKVANQISKAYPHSNRYRFRGEKFVVDLRDPFTGLDQSFERELHYAIAEVSIQRKKVKHWRIVDGIFLTINQALFESCKEGRTITYEFIG